MSPAARATSPFASLALAARTPASPSPILTPICSASGARAAKRDDGAHVEFVEANAERLPFGDNSFDACSIAFGIRNVPRIESALDEAHRVLKRGVRFLCLEFSRVDVPVLDRLYAAWSDAAIPALGKVIAGDGAPYRYLVESIRNFPAPDRFAELIAQAGFSRASFTRLTGGIVALHSGWKL